MEEARNIWIIAGEPSGDRYGARLTAELRKQCGDVQVRGMGGAEMAAEGVDILVDSSELGIVGLIEVLKHLRQFRRIFWNLVAEAERQRPDAVVLIDYPGFNLRLARQLHKRGITVVYYVSPQVWAWGKRRIPKIARYVDKLLVIFPFEPAVFSGTGLDVRFVGHPLLEILAEKRSSAIERSASTVLLLPGSRTHEVYSLLPIMLQSAVWLHRRRPGLEFVVTNPQSSVTESARAEVQRWKEQHPELRLEFSTGRTLEWMQQGAAGIAASGTVTLEAAILGLPLVVAYRLNPLTYSLAKMLVKIPYFTIVNLVADKLVFEEYLQKQVTPEALGAALETILPDGSRRADVEAGMQEAVAELGVSENVSARVAREVLEAAGAEKDS